ncbi:MAG: HAMP domain-containing histidine kinase [Anaerolineales bacterium]|nr:HAMP domain-containing histidine kinase [Anaerolineales bacterium]
MNSLVVKLTLAFLLVGLIGAFLVALFVNQHTQTQFNQLILDQNQQDLINNITSYYQTNNSWEGIETVFRPSFDNLHPNPDTSPNPETYGPLGVRRTQFTLVSAEGEVIFGNFRGKNEGEITATEYEQGMPIKVDDETIAWLLFNPVFDRWRPGTPEGNFLINVNRATLYSAAGAAIVALLLGGILAFTMTRSLRELTTATQVIAQGELGHQVKVRSKDEIGTLADSFNQMSTELARSNNLRRQMTADIAHDLRTPLSVILGYSEALNDGKFTGSSEIFSIIHTEATHLGHLVDDLKTLSLADAGELPLTRQEVSPLNLLKYTATAYQIQAEKHDIGIKVDAAPDLPSIYVDVERMSQVLGNLVSNALRYTPKEGEIVLSALSQDGKVKLQVTDNGSGISPESIPYIFERSFRGDTARVQQSGEAGLGLAISKSLVEAHGGVITVKSELDKGTTFTIVI